MTDTQILLAAMQEFAKELDKSMRECTALVCSIVIASSMPGLDTPEKVVTACELVRREIIAVLREEMPK